MVTREVSIAADDALLRLLRTLSASEETPSAHLLECERAETLRSALAGLSNDHRLVIVLRSLELKSFEELAVCLARTPDAVRKLWYRAIEVLSERLEESDVAR